MVEKMLTIVLDADIDRELDRLANETGHSKPEIALEALVEWIEDREDAH